MKKAILFFLIIVTCFSIQEAFSAYCLKGWKGNEQEVDAAFKALAAEGFLPVRIIKNNTECYILLGEFPTVLDAKWYQLCFEKRGVRDLTIQHSLTLRNNFENGAPDDFYLFGKNIEQNNNIVLDMQRKEIVEFEKFRSSKDYTKCEELVDTILLNANDTDPIKGWANLKKAYLAYRDARYDEAEAHFVRVAKGEVLAPRDLRLEAMNRAARMYLKKGGINNIVKFYRGLDELQNQITNDAKFKAELQADKAWIVMEAAREAEKYGGGTFEDARREMEKVFLFVSPKEAPQTCALAELMYMESFAYEGRPEIAIELAEQLIEKYPDQIREKSMALIFLGVLEYQRGNFEKGYKWLERVHNLGIDPKNQAPVSFGKIYPLRHSAMWLKIIARELKRDDLVEYWENYLVNNY